ncbi:hypothetical protein QNJ24_11190 [Macrococcus caseolyticus]|uniref:Uncharacterized protein n=1 Tax=Macrococcus psychrotolerans TaxID=3039389 RepID=A0AAU6RPV4_9STAP|nr:MULTISPECIES: hypothetical protein [Bacilli]MDH5045344.1 hypothetical protein [Enterococcus faecalis]MDJ1110598.1 hypothetical protein [Macrococcus caseolyticus]MDJ1156625.1 hypothetical protein [Macrococcus caseolyticus]QYA41231.1 hypothetical protein KYI09_11480 [Macrococcus caseolyticus]
MNKKEIYFYRISELAYELMQLESLSLDVEKNEEEIKRRFTEMTIKNLDVIDEVFEIKILMDIN